MRAPAAEPAERWVCYPAEVLTQADAIVDSLEGLTLEKLNALS
jgi:hypothetical protein